MKGFMFFAAVTLFTAISTSAQVPTNAVAVTVNPPANPTILQLPQPIAAGDSVVVGCNFAPSMSLTFSDNQNASYTTVVPRTTWNSSASMGQVVAAPEPVGGTVKITVGFTASSNYVYMDCYAVELHGTPTLDGSVEAIAGSGAKASATIPSVSAGDNVLGFVFCQSCAGGLPDSYLTVVNSAWDVVLGTVKTSAGPLSVDYTLKSSQTWLVMTMPFRAPASPVPSSPTLNMGSVIVACTATGNATHSVSLGWAVSTNSTAYNVYRGPANGGPYTLLGSSASTTYTDATVMTGNIYYYVVTAVNAAGESGYSNDAVATIP
jgi:hypothetical protein